MANLLSKFRIDYSTLTMVQDITEKPKNSTIQLFESLIADFRESTGSRTGKTNKKIQIGGLVFKC